MQLFFKVMQRGLYLYNIVFVELNKMPELDILLPLNLIWYGLPQLDILLLQLDTADLNQIYLVIKSAKS